MNDSADFSTSTFSVNGRSYSPPARPIVVICVDGCGDGVTLNQPVSHARNRQAAEGSFHLQHLFPVNDRNSNDLMSKVAKGLLGWELLPSGILLWRWGL